MPYVPNATDPTEPQASQKVESAALEFRTLKTYVTGLAAGVTASQAAAAASALAASGSAAAAAIDLAAVQSLADQFDDRYLGSKAVAPMLDNDGNALLDGAMYFDTSMNLLRVYDLGTAAWITLPVTALASLTDVVISAIAAGELLMWDGAQWLNRTLAEAGIQAADANTAKLNVTQAFTSPQRSAVLTDNDLSFDLGAKQNFKATPIAGGTLTFTNIPDGQSGYILLINGANFAIAAAATTKISATALAAISVTGTYRLDYASDGTNVYVTASESFI